MKVALGGTFDPVHDGHRRLFERAFERGDVTVGLTSDDLAQETRHEQRPVRSFDERKHDLDIVLSGLATAYDRDYEIRTLHEPTGIAAEEDFDVLVVSPETENGGREVNDRREAAGLSPLDIEVVDHLEAADGDIVSSTRIVRGEIDEHGTLTPDREGRPRME